MKRSLSAAFGAAALLFILQTPEVSAQTTWNAYTYAPAITLPNGRHVYRIAEEIDKATNGALKIQVHLAGALPISSTNITQGVSDDVVQFGDDAFFHGNVPITGIMRLPMLINSIEEFNKAAAIMRPYFDAAYAKKGIVVLSYYNYPLQTAFTRKPMTSLADMKGMKLRVTSPEQGEFVKRMGGIPVTLGAAEVPSALDRGVVEGAFTASSGGGKLWKDLLAHNYRLGSNFFDAVLIVNKEAYEKLAPDVREKLKTLVVDAAPLITADLKRDEEEFKNKLGFTVTEAKPEDIDLAVKVMAPYWDTWAKSKGPDAAEALAKVRAALGR